MDDALFLLFSIHFFSLSHSLSVAAVFASLPDRSDLREYRYCWLLSLLLHCLLLEGIFVKRLQRAIESNTRLMDVVVVSLKTTAFPCI